MDHHPLPHLDASLSLLFQCMPLADACSLLVCTLTERQVVVTASHPRLVTHALVAVAGMAWPLRWVSVFVPCLPGDPHDLIQVS